MCWTRYNLFPKNLLECITVTALDVRVLSFAPTVGAKMRFKNAWLKSPKKQLSLNIMTKINNDSMSQCFLHCLKQTESKYGEALVHSSGLSKHGTFLIWKITKMRKICHFSFSQKFCHTFHYFFASECHSRVLLLGLFSIFFYDAVMSLVVTVLDLSSLPPKSKNRRICVLTCNDML